MHIVTTVITQDFSCPLCDYLCSLHGLTWEIQPYLYTRHENISKIVKGFRKAVTARLGDLCYLGNKRLEERQG